VHFSAVVYFEQFNNDCNNPPLALLMKITYAVIPLL